MTAIGLKDKGIVVELAAQLKATTDKRDEFLRYAAHLSALLREACTILEDMEVTIEVSEPLQCWWEKEKRKREAKECYLLSSTSATKNVAISGQRVEPGTGVGPGSGVSDSKLIVPESNDNLSKPGEKA